MTLANRNILVSSFSLLLAAGTATAALADEPVRTEVSTQQTRPNRSLISSGIVTLGMTYGASAIVAAQSDRSDDKRLFVPVAGPWMDLTTRGGCPAGSCSTETAYKVLLVTDGVFQGLGALDIVAGFLLPETIVTSESRANTTTNRALFAQSWRVHPMNVGGGYGVAATAVFF